MKDIRFYEEYQNKRKGESAGTVVAVYPDTSRVVRNGDGTYHIVYDATGGVFSYANSPVEGTSVAREYLAKDCKRVSEARARQVHPRLFDYLEGGE